MLKKKVDETCKSCRLSQEVGKEYWCGLHSGSLRRPGDTEACEEYVARDEDSRCRGAAESPEKYDRMVKLLGNAGSKGELEQMATLYIMDMSYPRADICLALKSVELEKGW